MKTIKRVFAALLIVAVLGAVSGCSDDRKLDGALNAMDTYMTFTLYGKNAEKALSDIKSLIQDCETRWSVTIEDSEISRLNREESASVSSTTAELLKLAKQYSTYTNGCFDPTVYPLVSAWGFTANGENRVPDADEIAQLKALVGVEKLNLNGNQAVLAEGTMVDLGGIAKGYAGDLCIASLKQNGIKSAIIRLGGNIQTLGYKPDGSSWRIGIQSPCSNDMIGIVSVYDKCVITSGAYERFFTDEGGTRYGHIISPFTGYPADNGLLSVTVICETGSFGDALSTALFVMGTEAAIDFWKSHEGFEVVFFADDGTLYVSEGIFPSFTETESKDVKTICEIKR